MTPTLRPRRTHYVDLGLTFRPAVADLMGWIDYREGYEQLSPEQWTEAERYLHDLAEEIAALKKGRGS